MMVFLMMKSSVSFVIVDVFFFVETLKPTVS